MRMELFAKEKKRIQISFELENLGQNIIACQLVNSFGKGSIQVGKTYFKLNSFDFAIQFIFLQFILFYIISK